MTVLLAVAIGGYPLLAYLFLRHMASVQADQRCQNIAHQNAIVGLHSQHREEIARLHTSHRTEVAQLNQARMEETADLLQRIQAPEQATATHAGENAPPDPPPVNLEDDEELFAVYEERLKGLALNG